MPKFNKWLSTLLRNKEKLEEIAITTVNAESDSEASINLLPHSIYKQLGLGALKPTRMTLELANRSVTHPMGIAEDVVVRVDGFTFLADFVVVNFEPDPRVPIILGRPFLRTAKALIDLYEEKLTLRVGSDELVFYAEKSEKSKNKQFAHAISVIDFLKDEPFSGSTTNHSDALPPSSSPVKTSEILEEFADELTLLKKEDVENENSNVSNSDEPVLLNTPLTDKVECFAPEDEIDEIDAFLAMEVSSNFEEGYFDSEGDVIFLENLLSDDTTHNLSPEGIFDHEPKQNESIHNSSISFSPRSDTLHHELSGELLTLPSRNVRKHEEYLSLMSLLCEISTSQSQENIHATPRHSNSVHVIMQALEEFKNMSGLVPSFLPVRYLGVPLISSRLLYQDCKVLVQKLESWVNDWRNKFLSLAGRLQLIRSVLSSMHREMKNGKAKVAWELVCMPQQEGADIAKITRKRLKPGKHEHGNGRARKKQGGSYQSQTMVKLQSTWSTKVKVLKYTLAATNVIHKLSLVNTLQDMPRGLVRKHKERDILHSFYTQKKHKKLQTTDCHAGNPCELSSDPTVDKKHPMISI
ncbi:reverse transcriptase domain-containing protein [Tanacetum coccineum]